LVLREREELMDLSDHRGSLAVSDRPVFRELQELAEPQVLQGRQASLVILVCQDLLEQVEQLEHLEQLAALEPPASQDHPEWEESQGLMDRMVSQEDQGP